MLAVALPGITTLTLAGGGNELPIRLPDPVFWIALPFLGSERGAEERERAHAGHI